MVSGWVMNLCEMTTCCWGLLSCSVQHLPLGASFLEVPCPWVVASAQQQTELSTPNFHRQQHYQPDDAYSIAQAGSMKRPCVARTVDHSCVLRRVQQPCLPQVEEACRALEASLGEACPWVGALRTRHTAPTKNENAAAAESLQHQKQSCCILQPLWLSQATPCKTSMG